MSRLNRALLCFIMGCSLNVFGEPGRSCASVSGEGKERLRIFVSDLHLGIGKTEWPNLEDFWWSGEFAKFVTYASSSGGSKTDLVLVGDTFELWQSANMKCPKSGSDKGCKVLDCEIKDQPDLGCREDEALTRARRVLKEHQDVLGTLRAFAKEGDNRVVIIPGNHDAALFYDNVADDVLKEIGAENDRVCIAKDGYWLSPDGQIYADHGHEYDKVNGFKGWPRPFEERNGVRHLIRPAGEHMVQNFYNQYEQQFPVIDNLSKEWDGIKLAVKTTKVGGTVEVIGKALRFFLFENTSEQFWDWLGDVSSKEVGSGTLEWDLDAVKRKDAKFLVESLVVDEQIHHLAQEALERGEVSLKPSDLTDNELQVLCDKKFAISKKNVSQHIEPCPVKDVEGTHAVLGEGDATLGYIADRILSLEDKNRAEHLMKVWDQFRANEKPIFRVYVYGHTHAATSDTAFEVNGDWTLKVFNTGAFQRVATIDQLGQIKKEFAEMRPDDLPPCYTFVRINPYDDRPKPTLNYWLKNKKGEWVPENWKRDCLSLTSR